MWEKFLGTLSAIHDKIETALDKLEAVARNFARPVSETSTTQEKIAGVGKAIIAGSLLVVTPAVMLFVMPLPLAAMIMGGAVAAGGAVMFGAAQMKGPKLDLVVPDAIVSITEVSTDSATPALQVKSPAADFSSAVENKGADAVVKTEAPAQKPTDQPKI